MTQYEFDKTLEKYLAGTHTPEEETVILNWYNRLESKPQATEANNTEAAIGVQLWKKIQGSTTQKKRIFISWMRYGTIAASVILALWIGWQGIGERAKSNATVAVSPDLIEDIEVKNNSEKPQEIKLEDGSFVVLQPQSKLSYADHFNKATRTVYLQGEGFFKVKRDTTKPFQVKTGDLTTEVLGTSFSVKQNVKTNTIEVAVASGKVSVYENIRSDAAPPKRKILTQNQKISFRTDTKQLIASIVPKPLTVKQKPLVEPSAEFTFEDAPLRAVFDALEQQYLLKISIETAVLNRCVFNGDLNGLPLFTQLDLICKSVDAQFEIKGTEIFVTGKGCEENTE